MYKNTPAVFKHFVTSALRVLQLLSCVRCYLLHLLTFKSNLLRPYLEAEHLLYKSVQTFALGRLQPLIWKCNKAVDNLRV